MVGEQGTATAVGPGGAFTRVTTQTGRPAWQVNSHAAVRSLSRDPRVSIVDPMLPGTAPGGPAAGPTGPAAGGEPPAGPLAWSKALHRAFSPERVNAMRPRMVEIVADLLSGIAEGRRPPDLHRELSLPLVTSVSCVLLGVPEADGLRFREWWEAVKTGSRTESAAGQAALLRYVRGLYSARQRDPGEDFVSQLILAQGPGAPYTDKAIKFLTSLISKGRETPINALDWSIVLLLREPATYRRLVADRSLLGPAVEEMLRLFPVISGRVQGPEGIRRFASTDLDSSPSRVRRGDLVLLNVVAANMDPIVFPEPDRFDITRSPNPHLSFGFGPHACPAARLARLELEVALGGLLERFPDLRLAVDPSDLDYQERPTSRGFAALPVTW